jgi:hypothetical protein
MSRTSLILTVLVYGMALAQSLPAIAGGVSDADLRGKKICWNSGGSSSYSKDGSFDGTFAGHGTWTLVGDQIEVHGDHGSGVNTITKDGYVSYRSQGVKKWQGYRILGQILQLSSQSMARSEGIVIARSEATKQSRSRAAEAILWIALLRSQ